MATASRTGPDERRGLRRPSRWRVRERGGADPIARGGLGGPGSGPVGTIRLSRELSRLPAFAGCDRRVLRRVAQWGDVVEVEAGEVLVRRDHGDHWFFVVLSGRVEFTTGAASEATDPTSGTGGAGGTSVASGAGDGPAPTTSGMVGPGRHFGEWAIVGLRPQPATARTAEPSVLFVLGARYVMSLLITCPGFQRALFPAVPPHSYLEFARRMNLEGRADWRRLVHLVPALAAADDGLATASHHPPGGGLATRVTDFRNAGGPPGRPLSLSEAAALLARVPLDLPPTAASEGPWRSPEERRRIRRRWSAVTSGVAAAVAVPLLLLYHPPRAVISAGRPIDVARDIHISGAAVHPPTGRYLLLWVHASRPNLAGYLAAVVHGRTMVGVHDDPHGRAGARAAEHLGRQQYLDSQRVAVADAAAMAGMDPHRLSVTIRDRGFVGPSAGLVYALALDDLLSGRDLAGGRVVAATGALEPDGRVDAVGWVNVKARGASAAGAAVLLVPAGQQGDAGRAAATVFSVSSFRQALEDLAGDGPAR